MCRHGVILKVLATNICGSDQHMVRGRTTAPEGLVLGHEITGEVIERGPDVEFIEVGDVVSVPFNIACGRCRNCKERQTGICLNVNPARPGGGLRLRRHGRLGRRPGRVRHGAVRGLQPAALPRPGRGAREAPRPDHAVGHLPDRLPRRGDRGRRRRLHGVRRGSRAGRSRGRGLGPVARSRPSSSSATSTPNGSPRPAASAARPSTSPGAPWRTRSPRSWASPRWTRRSTRSASRPAPTARTPRRHRRPSSTR